MSRREALDKSDVACPICDARWPMDDLLEESASGSAQVVRRDRVASERQAQQQRLAVLPSLEEASAYHVFMAHNSLEREQVNVLAAELRELGVLAWVDHANLLGGRVAMREIEQVLGTVAAIAVIVGPNSIGRWQEEEYYASLTRVVEARSQGTRVALMAVLLPGAPPVEQLPLFLKTRTMIDMRRAGVSDPAKLNELVVAILR